MKFFASFTSKIYIVLSLLVIGAASVFFWITSDAYNATPISYATLEQKLAATSDTASLKETSSGTLYLETTGSLFVTNVRPESELTEQLVKKYDVAYMYSGSNSSIYLFTALMMAMILMFFIMNHKGKKGVGASSMKHSASKETPLPDITLDDIGGLSQEMKDEIHQTLELIKDPKRSEALGLKAPKGLLLEGPPGTGKTLLAQAIAHEVGASFYSSSGAAFAELFVGVGASRVRTLFQNARKQEMAVIFIDEVDALAGKRKAHGGEETEKTLTELLVQLDGGLNNGGILFIAATNRKDMLDEAFLRPGRIDYTFEVPLPDTQGRREIMDIHTRGKAMAANVAASLDVIAESTSGFSGAQISALFTTASKRAVREGRSEIDTSDMDFAIDRTILGNTSRSLNDPSTKWRVAIHESGHALIAAITKPHSIRKATIIPRGQALGYVAPIQKEMHLQTASELLDQVSMILGGGIAERIYLGEHSIGVSGDVQQAKEIIERMVDTGLLQDSFTLTFSDTEKNKKMQELFSLAIKRTEELILGHAAEFDELVNKLFTKETLEGSEIHTLVCGDETPKLVATQLNK